MLQAIERIFDQLHFQYLELFILALLPIALTVIIHSRGMAVTGAYWKHSRARLPTNRPSTTLILIGAVAIVLATHALEIFAWALFYNFTELLPSARAALEFSISSYSTLGSSSIELPARWQGLDGFEAMNGMLMFAWSTAMLVAIVQQAQGLER